MLWASSLSLNKSLEQAVLECAGPVRERLGQGPIDLGIVFVSMAFRLQFEDLPKLLQDALDLRHWIGCSAAGVIGAGHEAEHVPALSVTAARLPDVTVSPFMFQEQDLPSLDVSPKVWEKTLGTKAQDNPQFLILADPYSRSVEQFLSGLDYAYPQAAKLGGLASGAEHPGRHALYQDGKMYHSGIVGVALSGNLVVDTLVAQGCRPIGRPLAITECQQNLLLGLESKTPLQVLEEIAEGLSERDRALLSHSLFLGVAQQSLKKDSPGDFLIRNIMGVDPEREAIYIGEMLRPGQIVQFHLRDSQTSQDDLEETLTRYRKQKGSQPVSGALLFSCLGRGRYLYGRPDHDTGLFLSKIGPVPLGGFFCNGEIGPVGANTYLHGYTSCFGIFRNRDS